MILNPMKDNTSGLKINSIDYIYIVKLVQNYIQLVFPSNRNTVAITSPSSVMCSNSNH